MATIYDTLDQALNALKLNVAELGYNVAQLRNDIANNGIRGHNAWYANQLLERNGFIGDESMAKLEQWGVLDAANDKEVEKIIYDVIDYRRDPMLHHCE